MSHYKTASKQENILPNPEIIYRQMGHMQTLLRQYDRQNQFLNRQVLELLDQRHAVAKKQPLLTAKYNSRNNLLTKTGRSFAEGNALNLRQSRTKRKKYEYIDDQDKQEKTLYTETDSKGYNQQRNRQYSTSKYHYTPIQNLLNKQVSKYSSNNHASKPPPKPFEIKSQMASVQNSKMVQNTTAKKESQKHRNLIPILKRQAYIAQNSDNSRSLSNSPGKNSCSKMSGRSSRKSGIFVTTSVKNSNQEQKNSNIISASNKNEQKQQDKNVLSPSKSVKRVSFSINPPQKLSQSIIKPQTKQKQTQQIQKQKPIEKQKQEQKKESKKQKQSDQIQRSNILPLSLSGNKQKLFSNSNFVNIPAAMQNKADSILKQTSHKKDFKKQEYSAFYEQGKQTAKFKFTEQKPNKVREPQIIKQLIIEKRNILRPSSSSRQFGVNTSPKQGSFLVRNRNFSQHRIQPSQKISYTQEKIMNRRQSQPQLRGNSRQKQGKKKFINLVSTSLLSQKMSLTRN